MTTSFERLNPKYVTPAELQALADSLKWGGETKVTGSAMTVTGATGLDASASYLTVQTRGDGRAALLRGDLLFRSPARSATSVYVRVKIDTGLAKRGTVNSGAIFFNAPSTSVLETAIVTVSAGEVTISTRNYTDQFPASDTYVRIVIPELTLYV